jgi:ABC-type protease/lipase transport system fused ATPase/permease subunit
VGYLPQSVELMEGTLAENIARFGVLDTDGILQAAQRAGVHELIQHLPQGYDTRIGEGGLVLSGGQRQRIGLARALYGDPSLIVLDEPNANLDEAGDAALQKALRELKERQRTLFVITHRQNVLALADYVLVLVDGAVQAYGPREQVFNAMKARMAPASAPVPRV